MKHNIRKIIWCIAFIFAIFLALKFDLRFYTINSWLIAKNPPVKDDCDEYNKGSAGAGVKSDKNPPNEVRERDCTNIGAVIRYGPQGGYCATCSTCSSVEPSCTGPNCGIDYDDETYCTETGPSTSYNFTDDCYSESKIKQGESGKCVCHKTEDYDCKLDTHTYTDVSIPTNACGNVTISCGNETKTYTVLCPACYRKEIKEGSYDYKWAYENPGTGYSKISNITSKDKCELTNMKVSTCSSNIVAPDQSGNASYCDGAVTLKSGKTDKCNNFYEITCPDSKNIVTTDFENGISSVKVGQGFSLKAKVTLKTECTGTFYDEKWNAEYEKLNKLIERANSAGNEREKKWYQGISNELVGIVTNYKSAMQEYSSNSVSNDKNIPTGTVTIKSGSNKVANYNFELDGKSRKISVDYKVTKTIKLKNNMTVENFTSNKTSIVELQPPQVYLNKNGESVASTSKDKIDAGHLFFTPMDLTPGNYTIEAVISKLGVNQNSKVTNSKCNIKLLDNDIDYRIIDVANPFGITTHTPGINWSNENYNFKNTINKETWSSNSLYRIKLDHDTLKTIQSENQSAIRENLSPYTGLCQSIESGKTNPYNKSKLCDLIK